MKFLHTADWHVGKVLKGRSRIEEHTAVLGELVELARSEDVDATIVAGDLFDTAAPTPESQSLVMRTLLALRDGGRDVVVIAGNHDNPHLFDVYRPVLGALGIHVLGTFRRPEEGGTPAFVTRAGEPVTVAALPFLSHRYAVRALDLLTGSTADHTRAYAHRMHTLLEGLTAPFTADSVNIVVAHATLPGAKLGGGEREAQSLLPYYVEPGAFPPLTSYAALGHLHLCQKVATDRARCPIWYSGPPLAVDFGDADLTPSVLLVTAEPGRPARVRRHPLAGARELRVVRGTMPELEALADTVGEAWLRVVVAEPPRAGLADAVRQVLPGALEVDVDELYRPGRAAPRASGVGVRSPRQLFLDYLGESSREDKRVIELFDRLCDEESAAESPDPTGTP